jgi:hypothetical protein
MNFQEAQETSQVMLDELEQHAKGFRKALTAWRKNPNLDTQAKLEAEVIILKIHAEQTEIALDEQTALMAVEN